MKHFGDITKINGYDVPITDIVCGGSPCQDLSVAGQRKGLRHSDLGDDETTRSGLFMEMIRIIKEMRDADRQRTGNANEFLRPRFVVFENVEGLFSSNGGEDFRIVLEEFVHIIDSNTDVPRLPNGQTWSHSGAIMGDRWSIAWRLHNSQFWGVPQRRKRVSLVADFGGQSAPQICFEQKGLHRDLDEKRESREGTSSDIERSVDGTSITLKLRGGAEYDSQGRKSGKGPLIQEELSGTVGAVQDQTLIRVYGISPEESNAMKSKNPNSGIYEAETSRTLDNNGGKPDCKQGGMMIVQEEPISYGLDRASFNQGYNAKFDISVQEEIAQPIVARGVGGGNDNQVVGSLQARDYKGVGNQYVNEGKVIVQRTD